MIRLMLVRHGETIWNAAGKIQGQTDIPLNDEGKRQAAALARRLAGVAFDAIYSSDLRRALDTAVPVAEPHGLPVLAEPRLRQSAKGVWEGLNWEEIRARYPAQFAAWHQDQDALPPGGEPRAAYVGRLASFLDHTRAQHADQTVLAVTHGHVIRTLICLALAFPTADAGRFRTENTGLTELYLYPDRGVLARLNDRADARREAID